MANRTSKESKAAAEARRNKPAPASKAVDTGEQALFERIPVAMHEIDRQGFITRVNRAECTLLGFGPGDLIGRHACDFVSPAAREASREAVRRKLAGELPLVPFSREFWRQDGVYLILEIHEDYILDEAGEIAGIRSAMLDVSERQRVQEELRRAREELEARVRNRTAELARANQALESEIDERRRAEQRLSVQYSVARVLAEAGTLEMLIPLLLENVAAQLGCDFGACWALVPEEGVLRCRGVWPRTVEAAAAFLEGPAYASGEGLPGQVLATGEPAWVELPALTKPESNQPGSGFACALAFPVEADHTVGVMAFFYRQLRPRDEELLRTAGLLGSQIGQFVDRKRAEIARDSIQARFTAFMDNLPGVAFLKDTAGRYVYFNAGIRLMTARDPESIINKPDAEIWPPDVASASAAHDRRVLETHQPVEALYELPLQKGTRSWLVYKFPMPDPEGRPTLIGGVAVDVTERQILESQLRQSQKMDAVGRLAGGVAHDFNNLLTIIGGYGRMVLDQLPAGDRARSSMEQVLNAADRAAVLTSQLLAFSRSQAAQPKVIELNHVVSNLEKMLRRVIGEDIILRTSLDPQLSRVKADPGQMEQVLMNLAVNSRDAMPKGGTLTIETVNAVFGGSPRVRLSVIDSGVGMDAQTKSHIFEPFFTTKGRGKGTGLGLSTVYGIIKQHGGEVVVESEPGAGARFHIYLPAIAGQADTVAKEKAVEVPGGGETILLVEDEAGVRRVARDALRGRGYRVLEAADGQEALRVAEAHTGRIHLLVTDMIMPLMSGRELARRLQERDRKIRIIFMSGYTDDVIAYHGEVGADAEFLHKPFAPEVLARKVREVLDARKGAAKASPRGGGR